MYNNVHNLHVGDQQGAMNNANHSVIYMLSRFPLPPWKCSLGISLTENDLSFRYRYIFSPLYTYVLVIY